MLVWPLRILGMILAGAQRAVAAAERVDEILATAPVIGDHAGGRPLPDAGPDGHRGEVRFRDVRFSYAPDLPVVLDGFELTVRAGESVALVGAPGSDPKSTRMNAGHECAARMPSSLSKKYITEIT